MHNVFLSLSIAMVTIALTSWQALRISCKRMKLPELANSYAKIDLPTVTVAIPARNETKDLEECLASLTSSTYPKLEIIILDDCSQDRRTPEIIQQFARDGVRFLKGNIPPEPWLAKNFAYEQLRRAANGDYILFCGVDARFEPQAITRIIEGILQSNKSMVSLMPVNEVSKGKLLPYLIHPMRYGWEIALPRRWAIRPPVLSTCWLAKKEFLKSAGGFSAVTQAILPERYFARLALKNTQYGFYRSDSSIGLTTIKSGPDQLETAMRTRYPQMQRSPEYVLALGLTELSLAILPLLFVVHGLLTQDVVLVAINVITALILSFIYGSIDKITYESLKLISFVAMPFALVSDFVVLHVSMYRYEFSEVLWKGRNICLPHPELTRSVIPTDVERSRP